MMCIFIVSVSNFSCRTNDLEWSGHVLRSGNKLYLIGTLIDTYKWLYYREVEMQFLSTAVIKKKT